MSTEPNSIRAEKKPQLSTERKQALMSDIKTGDFTPAELAVKHNVSDSTVHYYKSKIRKEKEKEKTKNEKRSTRPTFKKTSLKSQKSRAHARKFMLVVANLRKNGYTKQEIKDFIDDIFLMTDILRKSA